MSKTMLASKLNLVPLISASSFVFGYKKYCRRSNVSGVIGNLAVFTF